MGALNLADNIVRLRHERKITQEELADFVGVTKASVSKWESGKSTPDILLLPLLASFFEVTVDELMGYEPWLSKEQIRRIYGKLCLEFTKKSFEEAFETVRSYVRRYYSCYPFLLQVVTLYINHFMLVEDPEECQRLLQEAEGYCNHILKRCTDVSVREDATSLKAMLYLFMGKTKEAIEILENLADPLRISEQNDGVLIQAYTQAGQADKAKGFAQIRIYQILLSLIADETFFLTLYQQEPEKCEETIRRVKGVIELYSFEHLHPNASAQFYYQAAIFYAVNSKDQKALEELTNFERCVCTLIKDPGPLLKGDEQFDRIEEWFEQSALGNMAPRDKSFIKESTKQALSHPAFYNLKETEQFQKIYRHIIMEEKYEK